MYRIVIIEDNALVRRALVESVDWASLDCEVVAEAMDGLQGKSLILAHRPHIVITDIKMPKCDGLQMIEELLAQLADVRFLLITGYQNFEYARRAVKLGVADILLKPVKNTELIAAVQAMLDKRAHDLLDDELRNALANLSSPADREQARELLLGMNAQKAVRPAYSLLVRDVLEYIRQHYATQISLSNTAREFHMNASYLSALIRRETGVTFVEHVNRARVDAAKALLCDARHRVNEVGTLVGFGDETHFSKTFKRYEGVTPSEFRNR